jgi:hypothetical protein
MCAPKRPQSPDPSEPQPLRKASHDHLTSGLERHTWMEVRPREYLLTAIAGTIGERCAWQAGDYDPDPLEDLDGPFLERYTSTLSRRSAT